jgi:endonuclease/exonuclease/phosphatase family metal-dependent hydrolase
MRKLRFILPILLLVVALGIANSCKNKKPSVLKVFVRSASNELVDNAMVTIIGDVNSNPETAEYVDTLFTNSSGFAFFDLAELFKKQGEKRTTGYLDIVSKKFPKEGNGRVRVRAHLTSVQTVYLTN